MRRPCLALALCSAVFFNVQAAPAAVHGPYQDVSLDMAAGLPRIASMAWQPERGRTLVWAFATGACGQERWSSEVETAAFAALNVAEFRRAGQPYIIATGGEAGIFTCDSAAGLRRFVARYDSPQLVGLDFDIEGRQTPRQIGELVAAGAALQQARPGLRISFTLATHASADGSLRSLNATGDVVMAALAATHFDAAVINLMVMNYGPADARWCVLRAEVPPSTAPAAAPACDMGRSAIQAAQNVHAKYGVPFERIALTAMLGENDVAGNVFTPADAQVLAAGARQLGLAGVHYWSLGRDQPCAAGSERVSSRCHGLPGVPAGRFGQLLALPGR